MKCEVKATKHPECFNRRPKPQTAWWLKVCRCLKWHNQRMIWLGENLEPWAISHANIRANSATQSFLSSKPPAALFSHIDFSFVTFFLIVRLSPDLSSASPTPSIFSLQTNLQPNSHPILILFLLQCSFLQPLAWVDRCRERTGGGRVGYKAN